MNVFWLEQTKADLPAEDDWLSPIETGRLNAIRFAGRRTDWRLGRWVAKCAVSLYLNERRAPLRLNEIEIRAAPTGAPEVFIGAEPSKVAISLTHRSGKAMCAITDAGVAVGCDIEVIEPRTAAFVADYFTHTERQFIGRTEPSLGAALLWSAKESVLKVLRVGLRWDTRDVSVTVAAAEEGKGWLPFSAACVTGDSFQGWWRRSGSFVQTIVAVPPSDAPVRL